MAKKEDLIKAALRAYPDSDLLPVDYGKMRLKKLVDAATKNEFGDTLASFVVIELSEGLDEDDKGNVGTAQAAALMGKGVRDLQAVVDGLRKMEKHWVYAVVEMHQGVISDVNVYGIREAAEARETAWLKETGIKGNKMREHKAEEGTEAHICECCVYGSEGREVSGHMTPEEYARSRGARCPVCHSRNITSTGQIQGDGDIATCEVTCSGCGASWTEHYYLAGFTGLEVTPRKAGSDKRR